MKPIEIQQIENVSITITEEIKDAADVALMSGQFIKKVTDEKTQDSAIKAVKSLKEITTAVEKARKECKKPFLDKGRELDKIAQDFIAPLMTEQKRITAVMTQYTVEKARIRREAEEKRLAEQRKADEERKKAMEAVEKAKTESEKIIAAAVVQETFIETKNAGKEIVVPEKKTGIYVRRDLMVSVVDIMKLLKARPDLVEVSPKLGLIKAVLKEDDKPLPGVKHEWIENAIIR
jgi:hypothetical protein